MADHPTPGPGDDEFRQRLTRLQSGHADAHNDAERLRDESRRLAGQYAVVRATTRAQWDARRAALNLLEDAEEARNAERRELIERRRMDEALRASEEKYRTLFERMDEAYCIIEIIFDAAGRPVDFLMLDANPAFYVETGLQMVGRRVREVIPSYEQSWIDHYGRVAVTGEPVRFQGFVSGLGRWFESSAFRLGDGDTGRVAVLFTNITERKKAEEALRESEARMHTAVSLAQLGICNWDVAADAMHGNGTRFAMLGLNPATEAISVQQFVDLLHPEDRERVWPQLMTDLEKRGEYSAIYRIVRTDGIVRWISEAGQVSEWRDGVPLRVNSVLFDITTHREAEAAVRESETRFRTLTDAVPQLIWASEASGRTTYFNQRWFDYSGLELEGSVGPGWQAVVHPEDAPIALERWYRALAVGGTFDSEFRLRRADGAYRWHLGRNVPLRGEDGRVRVWFGSATDIHDLKEAEAAVLATQERLRLIVESATEHAIVSLDRECRVMIWNPGTESIFGYHAAEMIGRKLDAICTPEDNAARWLEQEARMALVEGRAGGERWHVRKDGRRIWVNCAMLPMAARPDGEVIGFVKIMRDETAALETRLALEQSRATLEEALRQTERARAEAEAAGAAKDQFLAVLSHELRTPLTPVLMAAHMLGLDPELSDMAREALAVITRNVRLEARFIDELLDLTRIARGKLELAPQDLRLHETIRHAVQVAVSDLDARGQRLTVTLDAPDDTLHGDPARLQQVFWNLLKNASKFTPEGGRISLRSHAASPGWIVVEIADTGIGMEKGTLTKVFDPFEQAGVSITRKYGGLGLGLAITKAAVEAHGGTITAGSAGQGQGSTFTVSLPLAAAPEA